MIIHIKSLTGRTTTLDVDPQTTTIGDIKKRIEQREDIPVSAQRLVHSGATLKDDTQKLADTDIKDGDSMYLLLHPRSNNNNNNNNDDDDVHSDSSDGDIFCVTKQGQILSAEIDLNGTNVDRYEKVVDRIGKVPGSFNQDDNKFKATRCMLPPVKVFYKKQNDEDEDEEKEGKEVPYPVPPTIKVTIKLPQHNEQKQEQKSSAASRPSSQQQLLLANSSHSLLLSSDDLEDDLVESIKKHCRSQLKLSSSTPLEVSMQLSDATKSIVKLEKDEDLVNDAPSLDTLFSVTVCTLPFLASNHIVSFTSKPMSKDDSPFLFASTSCHLAKLNTCDVDEKVDQTIDVVARRFNFNHIFGDEPENEKVSDPNIKFHLREKDLRQFKEECEADCAELSKLPPHPNLVPVIAVVRQDAVLINNQTRIEGVPRYLLHENKYETNLAEVIHRKEMTRDLAVQVAHDVFDAVLHLHKHNIEAGNIRPENILLSGLADLADHGHHRVRIGLVDYGLVRTARTLDGIRAENRSSRFDAEASTGRTATGRAEEEKESNQGDDDDKKKNDDDDDDDDRKKNNNIVISLDELHRLRLHDATQRVEFERRLIAAPEMSGNYARSSRPIDFWDFGVVVLRMIDALMKTTGLWYIKTNCFDAGDDSEVPDINMQDSSSLTQEQVDISLADLRFDLRNYSCGGHDENMMRRKREVSLALFDIVKRCLKINAGDRRCE